MPDPQATPTPPDPGPPHGSPPARRSWAHPFARPRAACQARRHADHHAALARAGYHLGPTPYGYRPLHLRIPDPDGTLRRRTRLLIDPATATTAATIYRWRVGDRLGHQAIAEQLAGDPDAHRSPTDPHSGTPRPWTAALVGRILTDPAYTGATAWVPPTTAGRAADPDTWVICPHAHEPLVDGWTFFRAQLLAPPGTRVITPALPTWECTDLDADPGGPTAALPPGRLPTPASGATGAGGCDTGPGRAG